MTDLKFSILEKLYKANRHCLNKNELISQYRKQMTNARRAIEDLVSQGVIRNCNDLDIELTPKGEDAYEDAYDQRKQNRHNFTIALISVIAASIAALVPLIEFIVSLIK